MEPKLLKLLSAAVKRHRQSLFAVPGVVSVGVGVKRTGGRETGEVCLVIGVRRKLPQDRLATIHVIPPKIRAKWYSPTKAIKTDVVEMGEIKALGLAKPRETTGRMRPAPPGSSIGHVNITAGTFGLVVRKGGKKLILSNSHVLANSGDAQIGDYVVQPGPIDGGKEPQDRLARLLEHVPIRFDGDAPGMPDKCPIAALVVKGLNLVTWAIRSQTHYAAFDEAEPNYVDAALAQPLADEDLLEAILDAQNKPTIIVKGIRDFKVGDKTKKHGRTTDYKEGKIISVGTTVKVQYGQNKTATLEDQDVGDPPGFSAGGDSGSAVLHEDDYFGGLLFAGSDQVTIMNPARHVVRLLGIEV